MNVKEYFVSLFKGLYSLVQGMEVTGKELVTPKVTEQYPENRATLNTPSRFRATLQFVYDEEGNHKCTACRTCERNCPNGTISVSTRMVDLPNGKKKMKLDKYMYNLGSCTFCNLCVTSCPFHAIEFSNDFEQAIFSRERLIKQLNYLPEKEEPAPAVAPAAPAKPAEAPKAAPAETTKAAPAEAPKAAPAKPVEAPKAAPAKPAEAPKAAPAKPAEAPKAAPAKEETKAPNTDNKENKE